MTESHIVKDMKKLPYTVGDTILEVVGVNKAFNGNVVLRDVNFEIPDVVRPGVVQGQVFAILGKSGRGKTTLARIIAGLLEPTSGEIRMGSARNPVRPGEVGFVFQNYMTLEHLTVFSYLMVSAYLGVYREESDGPFNPGKVAKRLLAWILQRKELKDRVEKYLDMFDLRQHVDKYPCELSGGQRQRLAILSQVLCSSKFIIFDEPFSGQDPEMKRKACEALIKTAQLDEFQTLGIITHDIACAVWVADKLLFMGKESDPATQEVKPGSTVFKPYDLAAQGLAWQGSEILRTKEFRDLVDEIEYSWFPNM
jgi:ABC-type sugar transport system ATPase subunit